MEQNNGNDLSEINALYAIAYAIQNNNDTPWSNWTPLWTNLTVGDGVLNWAKYKINGKIVYFKLKFTWGTTTSCTASSAIFTLPITASTNYEQNNSIIGNGLFVDVSTGLKHCGVVAMYSTTHAIPEPFTVSGTSVQRTGISTSVPFTWTTSDSIDIQGFYEIP